MNFLSKVQQQCLHLVNWIEKDHKSTKRIHEEYKEEIKELKKTIHNNTCTQEQLVEKIELLEIQIATNQSVKNEKQEEPHPNPTPTGHKPIGEQTERK